MVEDEPALAALLAKTLRGHGFEVDVCHTGAAALERLCGQYRAAVVDLALPDMGGEEVVRGLNGCPVIVSSGTPVASDYFGVRTPPVVILQKPYLPGQLLEELSRLLEG